MSMDDFHLQLKDLSIYFEGQTEATVSHLNLKVKKGSCVGLVGESGSGKSLTAQTIMQLLPPSARVSAESEVLFNGNDLLLFSERDMQAVRGRQIGLIFQDAATALNPVMTIAKQLFEQIKGRDKLEKAIKLLDEVGIRQPERVVHSYPHQLSGGMRQRAMIAMALAGEPELLIADEPTTALDVTIQAQVIQLLQDIRRDRGMSMIFISHDLPLVSKVADDVVVLREGQVIEVAAAKDFFHHPNTDYGQALLTAAPDLKAKQATPSPADPLLAVKDLKVYFPIKTGLLKRTTGYVKAVDGVSYEVMPGQTLAIVGESGSGKTTNALAVLKLLKEAQGEIVFAGQSILERDFFKKKSSRSQFRQDVQIVFQDPYAALNPKMMVRDSLAEGLLAQGLEKSLQQCDPLIDDVLLKVNLDPAMKWRYPHEFSGGQRQRLCIARAVVLKPKLLLLDEPTSSLDTTTQMRILDLLESLQREFNLAYLLITHNLGVVAHMAHQVLVMCEGKVVEHGDVASVLNAPQKPYTQQLLESVPQIENEGELK
jgi:peptide/nickel transport system ATP-binding protein